MSQAWWSELGLFLDLIAFAILSYDLVSSIDGERTAREEIYRLERRAFNARYGVFAPPAEVVMQQQEDFNTRQDERRRASDASITSRKIWAWVAIAVATTGFIMQLYGGWPTR